MLAERDPYALRAVAVLLLFMGAAAGWGQWGTRIGDAFRSHVVVAEADRENATIIATDCNRGEIEAARTHWPFLRDRRIDAYAPLSQRFIDAS